MGSRRLSVARLPDHTDRLFRAYALCGSRADAEDLVQETFARVLERPRFVRRGSDLAYLMRVLRNTWVDFHRARSARPDTSGPPEAIDWIVDRAGDPGDVALDVQMAYEAMRELRHRCGRRSPPSTCSGSPTGTRPRRCESGGVR
ncbi:MAG TPA: RNA polymerase sigma factor [Thermoleophilaceae bacterium]